MTTTPSGTQCSLNRLSIADEIVLTHTDFKLNRYADISTLFAFDIVNNSPIHHLNQRTLDKIVLQLAEYASIYHLSRAALVEIIRFIVNGGSYSLSTKTLYTIPEGDESRNSTTTPTPATNTAPMTITQYIHETTQLLYEYLQLQFDIDDPSHITLPDMYELVCRVCQHGFGFLFAECCDLEQLLAIHIKSS